LMAKKARKSAGLPATSSRKTKKVVAVKSVRARKPVARKPARKTSRRSSADIAKLQKAIVKGLKSGKSVAVLSEELGVSRPYIYVLKNRA
jgi:hypothetical protein